MNRKSRPRNRSNSFTKNLTFIPTIDKNSKTIVHDKEPDRYRHNQSHLMAKSNKSQFSIMNEISELQALTGKRKQNSLYTQRDLSSDFGFGDIGNMRKQASNQVGIKGSFTSKNEPKRKVASTVYTQN